MKILLLDSNHPLITEQLLAKGFILEEDFTSSYDEVCGKIQNYLGYIPGVIEEALYTLLEKKPLYLVGGFGGASEKLIKLMVIIIHLYKAKQKQNNCYTSIL